MAATIHPIQISVLKKLMYSPGLRYSELKPKDMEGSQFTFHVEQLVNHGFITKEETLYQLTKEGKGLAGKLDLVDLDIEEQAKVSVLLVCQQDIEGHERLLLYTRKKSPFYNFQGFPTGKVKRGEDVFVAARRELIEETGLSGIPNLLAIRHYKVFLKDSTQLLEDKIYFVIKMTEITGQLSSGPEGEYAWVKRDSLWEYLKKPVSEIKELIEHLDDQVISFKEGEYSTEEF